METGWLLPDLEDPTSKEFWAGCARGELLFNPLLPRHEPVHRGIQLVFVRVRHLQLLGERGGMPHTGRLELRTRLEQSLGDHRDHQVPLATPLRRDEAIEARYHTTVIALMELERRCMNPGALPEELSLEGLK